MNTKFDAGLTDPTKISVHQTTEPAQPFCYLKQTSSSENPPHGWEVHFTEGDVALYTSPQPPADVPRLTLEDIWSVAAGCTIGGVLPADKLARAVEAEVRRRCGVSA